MGGWIKLHRKFTSWEWYTDTNTKVLFIHLLLSANHKKNRWRGIEVQEGELITSVANLSAETGLSKQSVRTSLKRLENTGEINKQITNKYTRIKVVNYSVYQDFDTDYQQATNNPTNNQLTNNQQATNKQLTTNKNEKNIKNDKNIYKEVIDVWNCLPEVVPRVKSINGQRKKMLDCRINEYGIESVMLAISNIEASSFLQGNSERGWVISFDWFIKPRNFVKVFEGNYTDKAKHTKKPSFDIDDIQRKSELNEEWDI